MLTRGLTAGGNQHHLIVRAALFGAMTLGTLTGGANIANAQQGRPAKSGDRAAQQIPLDQLPIDQRLLRDPEADPNLPGMVIIPGTLSPFTNTPLRLMWTFAGGDIGGPELTIVDPQNNPDIHGADYLGWNGEGSWLRADNGKIVVWNYKKNSITERYKSFDALPTSVLASLKNSESQQDYLASRQAKPAPRQEPPTQVAADSAVKQFFQNPQADPNLPGLESPVGPLKVSWNYSGGNTAYPSLGVNDPSRPTLHSVEYFGWNEEGSLLRGDDGKVYVWKLKENSLTE